MIQLLEEVDATLDHLIENAEALRGVDLTSLRDEVLDAFQKTQESLLQRLLRMEEQMVAKKIRRDAVLEKKRQRFLLLSTKLQVAISEAMRHPMFCKRKGKQLLQGRLAQLLSRR